MNFNFIKHFRILCFCLFAAVGFAANLDLAFAAGSEEKKARTIFKAPRQADRDAAKKKNEERIEKFVRLYVEFDQIFGSADSNDYLGSNEAINNLANGPMMDATEILHVLRFVQDTFISVPIPVEVLRRKAIEKTMWLSILREYPNLIKKNASITLARMTGGFFPSNEDMTNVVLGLLSFYGRRETKKDGPTSFIRSMRHILPPIRVLYFAYTHELIRLCDENDQPMLWKEYHDILSYRPFWDNIPELRQALAYMDKQDARYPILLDFMKSRDVTRIAIDYLGDKTRAASLITYTIDRLEAFNPNDLKGTDDEVDGQLLNEIFGN